MTVADVRAAAWAASRAGICVVPPREDGSKRPINDWKAYQATCSTEEELRAWYAHDRAGLGGLMGTISGNLEMLDFDDATVYREFRETAVAVGLGPLLERIERGYSELTPDDGDHLFYRCAEIAGNTKLAEKPGPPDAQGRPTRETLIETRGQGGYAVLAPSCGRVHPSGRPYRVRHGAFATIATISPEERAQLLDLCRSFSQIPVPGFAAPERERPPAGEGLRPGDDFARRVEWDDILTPHGWGLVHRSGDRDFWRRPGKDRDWSATTNYANSGLLYVFSSSTVFEPHRGYSKFSAYAILNHGGDFPAAARELARQGYGEQRPPPRSADFGPRNRASAGAEGDDAPSADGVAPCPEGARLPTLDADDHHLPRIAQLAWDAVVAANEPKRLFRFGGQLSRVREDDQGIPYAEPLSEHALRGELARAANWQASRKKGPEPVEPPMTVVRDLLSTPNAPLPILERIVEVPTFARDGSLQLEPGYHVAGRSVYAPPPGFAVPEVSQDPSAAEVAGARSLIVDELLGDFPFVADAERAHAVALLLLPFVRALIDGATPLHLIEKPMPGTGATLLVGILLAPAMGREPGIMTEGRDEDEWRKRITARLRTAPTAVVIDNLKARLDTASLAGALTGGYWEDRILGVSEMTRLPVRCAWVATGNNPAVSSEIARRTIRIRLDARVARPWIDRPTGEFRHPKLRDWAKGMRPQLVWAALTMVRAWLAEGKPIAPDAPSLGMYEEWSRVIGGILGTVGIPGFLGNLESFYDEADTEGAALRALIAAWWGDFGDREVGVADLYQLVSRLAIDLDLGERGEQSRKIRMGRLVMGLRDRLYQAGDGDLVTVTMGGTSHRLQQWRLERP